LENPSLQSSAMTASCGACVPGCFVLAAMPFLETNGCSIVAGCPRDPPSEIDPAVIGTTGRAYQVSVGTLLKSVKTKFLYDGKVVQNCAGAVEARFARTSEP
jgi:hypothetical protein